MAGAMPHRRENETYLVACANLASALSYTQLCYTARATEVKTAWEKSYYLDKADLIGCAIKAWKTEADLTREKLSSFPLNALKAQAA